MALEDHKALDFMACGGEMGALMRAYDRSSHKLGHLDSWSDPCAPLSA
jgi:hypothetical protein